MNKINDFFEKLKKKNDEQAARDKKDASESLSEYISRHVEEHVNLPEKIVVDSNKYSEIYVNIDSHIVYLFEDDTVAPTLNGVKLTYEKSLDESPYVKVDRDDLIKNYVYRGKIEKDLVVDTTK